MIRPDWLHGLGDPPPLDAAMAQLAGALGGAVPREMCRQCFHDPMYDTVLAALRDVARGAPAPAHAYGAVLFEHPDCVGGPDTIRLILPRALREIWLGGADHMMGAEVLSRVLIAGLWYWPDAQQKAFRAVAARLCIDWFADGRCDWAPDDTPLDHISDDILDIAAVAQIDPWALVPWLVGLETPQAEAGLLVLTHGLALDMPGYVGGDIGPLEAPKPYHDACAGMAEVMKIRAACAMLVAMTPEWFDTAFYQREAAWPDHAKDLSDTGRDWTNLAVKLIEMAERPATFVRPDLPVIP